MATGSSYACLVVLLTGIALAPAGMSVLADEGDPSTDVDEEFLKEIRSEKIPKAFIKANPGHVEEASKSGSGTTFKLVKDDRILVLAYDLEGKLAEKTYTCTDTEGNQVSHEKRLAKAIRAGCPAEITDEQVVASIKDAGLIKLFAGEYPEYESSLSESDGQYLYTMTHENRLLEFWHDGAGVTDKRFTCFEMGIPTAYEKKIKRAIKNCLSDPDIIEYQHGRGIPEGHPASVILDVAAVKAFMDAHPLVLYENYFSA